MGMIPYDKRNKSRWHTTKSGKELIKHHFINKDGEWDFLFVNLQTVDKE